MSKKLAVGANALVFDVKVGRGAFMKTEQQGLELARILIDLAASLGKRATAVLSDMNQPLGLAVGNALEVKEAMDTLRGSGPLDFTSHCLTLGVQLLLLTGQAEDEAQARSRLEELLFSGQALGRFRDLIEAQGGDSSPIDDPGLLPQAPVTRRVKSPREGCISQVDAMLVGLTALELGAGRKKKGEPVDHAVGVVLHKKIGDSVARGEDLCTIHARTDGAARKAKTSLLEAYAWQEEPVDPPPLIYQVVS
jgi:pyrimidine-nucleoside phosphorylase